MGIGKDNNMEWKTRVLQTFDQFMQLFILQKRTKCSLMGSGDWDLGKMMNWR